MTNERYLASPTPSGLSRVRVISHLRCCSFLQQHTGSPDSFSYTCNCTTGRGAAYIAQCPQPVILGKLGCALTSKAPKQLDSEIPPGDGRLIRSLSSEASRFR